MSQQKLKPPIILKAAFLTIAKGRVSNFLLTIAILLTAFTLIIKSHEQRQLYAELEKLEQRRDELDVQWRQLRLEQRVMAEHSRLEQMARNKLGMKNLDLKSERIVRQVDDE